MINATQVRELVVRPVLKEAELWSHASENLVMGTGFVESRFEHIKQRGGGPALSFWQVEPDTYRWVTYRARNDEARYPAVLRALGMEAFPANPEHMIGNMELALLICRLKYWYIPEALPEPFDIGALAKYWKKYYNTEEGRGSVQQFVHAYKD